MRLLALSAILALSACQSTPPSATPSGSGSATSEARGTDSLSTRTPFVENGRTLERATFATGCFWCTESDFDKVPGVIRTVSGYTGGRVTRATYDQVTTHTTGHVEAVQVVFDPQQITYERLLDAFWRTTDPTDDEGQFCDRGEPYRSAIFVHTPAQRAAAEASKAALAQSKPFREPLVTAIRPAEAFWAAEDYHQDFHRTTPGRYQSYRLGCGRDARLRDLWGG